MEDRLNDRPEELSGKGDSPQSADSAQTADIPQDGGVTRDSEVTQDGGTPQTADASPAPELPTAAKFLENTPVRFETEYELTERQYLEFNRFIFDNEGTMRQSRLRMKYLGIAELVFAVCTLAVGLFLQNNVPLFCFIAAMLAAAGVLSMLYYPYIFPRQFERSIRQSFAASGYMGRTLRVDFHDDGIVERSDAPVGALWEDVRGFYETDELALFLMDEHQAVVIPRSALGERYDEFRLFAESAMNRTRKHRG